MLGEVELASEELPAVHNLLLAALFAPGLLGVAPAEADSARRLALKAKVMHKCTLYGTKLTSRRQQFHISVNLAQ